MWMNGRWFYQEEVTDDAGEAGGGAGVAEDLGAGDGGAAPEGGEGGGGDGGAAAPAGAGTKGEAPKDMKSAIDAALGYKPAGAEAGEEKSKGPAAGEKKGEKPPAGDGKETLHANGAPKKNAKGEDLDDKGQVVQKQAPKPKTAAELDLKPEDLKTLGPKAQQRFREVIGTLKAHEGTIGTLTQQNKSLGEARDAILGVMQETHTTQDQLVGYLQFNQLIHSRNPKDIERAIEIVEEQRAALYKTIGKEPEGGGIDLLAEFPDLVAKVSESQITREDALEIANSRRERAAREAAANRQQQQQRTQTQTAEQLKKAHDEAQDGIDAWAAELAKSDLDYKAKEDKLLAEVAGVVKEYPPHLWLPTLKRLYAGIVIQKAPAASGGPKPLRPSGAKPGDKKPGDMLEAISQGLGYGTKG